MTTPAAQNALTAVFERAPQLVERMRVSPSASPRKIAAAARDALAQMSERERIAVLDAHPRIGADPASLSILSRGEQGASADAATLRELAELNDAYERRFGFRFVVFVAGRPKGEIVPVLRERLANPREDELARGIEEFLAISLDRLARAR
jgi:2-oxo-4-hydroxy-4-carboxy--5-ureidoimidazoline (OHCU) decarboxylase